MFRFFAAPQEISAESIILSKEDSEHIRALRLRPDELFIVCDGIGTDYVCRLGDRDHCTYARIVDKHPSLGEPSIECKVFMAYSKGERLEFAVQKSVELGVHEIILFESERCVAVPKNIKKKTERLQKIALETAKMCNRGVIPMVTAGGKFDAIIGEAMRSSELPLFFYESEDKLHIKTVLEQYFPPPGEQNKKKIKSVSLITGPEGGFEPHEVGLAQSMGLHIVSLGTRVLRSETAPVIALAAVMYQTNNL